METPYRICFYYIDEKPGDGYEAFEPRPVQYASTNPLQLNETLAAHNWQAVLDAVQRVIEVLAKETEHPDKKSDKKYNFNIITTNEAPACDIIILLTDTYPLTKRETLNNLVTTETDAIEKQRRRLRYVSTLHPRIGERKINDKQLNETQLMQRMRPIITISTEDISTLFAERDSYKPEEQGNKVLYQIRFDDRVKFWDSSIWHRYVALNEDFQENLKQVLILMADCHNKNLYHSFIAQENLELQTRIMLTSYLCSLGDHSHGRVVTPFKFHSELDMRMQKKKLANEIKGILGWSKPDGETKTAFWQMLLIDDYAHAQLHSHVPVRKEDSDTKLKIIQSVMDMPEDIGAGWVKIETVEEKPKPEDKQLVSEDISEKAIGKLSESVYDMLLLDYLLGKAKDSRNEREYGYDFLFKLQNGHIRDSKTKLKKGPLNKYWILPISSFPFAFSDKLRQLGMEGQSDHWIMSGGGDPITTPELFCYNLLNFIKQQIDVFCLDEASIYELLNQFSDISSGKLWRELALNALKRLELQRMVLENDEQNGSRFAQKMLSFIRSKQEKHQQLIEVIRSYIENIADIPYFSVKSTLNKQVEDIKFNDDDEHGGNSVVHRSKIIELLFEKSGLFFRTEARFISDLEKLKQKINDNKIESKNIEFEFDSRRLRWLPDDIDVLLNENHSDISSLRLSNNDLSVLPAGIVNCTQIKKLDLSYNNLRTLPENFNLLADKLEYLDLTGNKDLPDHWQQKHEGKTQIKEIFRNPNVWNSIRPKKLVVSYARLDYPDLQELKPILESMKHDKLITYWFDQLLDAGSEWDKEIRKEFLDADVVLFMMSRDFLASTYIREVEVPISLRRQQNKECKVIPIYLKDCLVDRSNPISKLNSANSPQSPIIGGDHPSSIAWKRVEEKVRAAIRNM